MREKIERFANGKFEYERRTLILSESRISFEVLPDSQYSGEFTISSGSGKPIKGIVSASTSRMQVENPVFLAKNIRIHYLFDSKGMYGSEVEEGYFCLITDVGEYQLPYQITARVQADEELNSYAYFISADPIEPPYIEEELAEPIVEIIEEDEAPLSLEEASRLVTIMLRSRQLLPGQFAKLKKAYFESESKELLSGICSILIKNDKKDADSFFWYKLGAQEEVKITNLYEYFIQAAPEKYEELLPRNILLYFLYNNTLLNKQRAFIYANVVRYADRESSLFREYRRVIEPFMLEQLLQRRISEDLALLYEEFLMEDLLTIDFAEALADIMFMRKLVCKDRRIKQVQVLYEQLSQRIVYPLKNGQAFVPIYTAGAKILLLDSQGSCYATSVPYTLERLLDEQHYIDKCKVLLNYHTGLYLHLCDGMSRSHVLNRENIELYKQVLLIEGFTESYYQQVRQEIIQYYYANHELDELDEEFFTAQTEAMLPTDRAKYIEILILRGLYENAWALVLHYGYSLLRQKILVRLAAWRIREQEFVKDDYLLKLCYMVFEAHKYNESILEYLTEYYRGSMDTMLKIWQAGMKFEINVFELEERILSQMLFTEQFPSCAFELFVDYERTGGNSLVSTAYLAYLAHQNFVEDKSVPARFYDFLEVGIAWDMNLPDICKLSYLRHLSEKGYLSEGQQLRANLLVKEFLYRRLRFGFMKELMIRLGNPHLLEDKTFVEYRANPEHKVVIHYVKETPGKTACNYVAERIYPNSAGVFVKEFTLFYGERLVYFVTETFEDGSEQMTQDMVISGDREEELETGSKYAVIYEMSRSWEERNEARLMEQMESYRKQQYLVETLFHLK